MDSGDVKGLRVDSGNWGLGREDAIKAYKAVVRKDFSQISASWPVHFVANGFVDASALPATVSGRILDPLNTEAREDESVVAFACFIEAQDAPVVVNSQVRVGGSPWLQHPRHRPGSAVVTAQTYGQPGAPVDVAWMGEQDAVSVEANDASLAGGFGKSWIIFDL